MAVVDVGLAANRLAVGYARLHPVDLHAEFALELGHQDVELHLALSVDERLLDLWIHFQPEAGIFFTQSAQARPHLFVVTLGIGCDGLPHHRLGKDEGGKQDGVLAVGQRVAGVRMLELDRGADVTGRQFLNVLAVVPVENRELAQALMCVTRGVAHVVARVRLAGDDTEDGQFAYVRFVDGLKHVRGKRTGRVGLDAHLVFGARMRALPVLARLRGRREIYQGIQQERRTHRGRTRARENGINLTLQYARVQSLAEFVGRQITRFKELLQERIIRFGGGFDHLALPLGQGRRQVGRHLELLGLALVVDGLSFARQHVGHTFDGHTFAHRPGKRHGTGTETGLQGRHDGGEVDVFAIDFGQHEHPWQVRDNGLAPCLFRTDLDARLG